MAVNSFFCSLFLLIHGIFKGQASLVLGEITTEDDNNAAPALLMLEKCAPGCLTEIS